MKNNTQEIYIHIPFCERKCDYCDFVSFVCNDDVKERYFSRLLEQIDIKSESMGSLPVDSVFIGGGTPSAVNEKYISMVLDQLRKRFVFTDKPEITMEMNPNSVTKNKLKVYADAGVNRVSIGLQSADDEELKVLSRLHNYDGFLRTYEAVREVGFDNVNIDIMSALPGQSRESYMETLKKVTVLKPEHISAYSLIIEEGTVFFDKYSSGEGLPDEETDRAMYHDTKSFLREMGYERYEISNYSKPGFECKHNLGYWTRKPYVGFGIAAASLFDETRYQMHGILSDYLKGDFSEEKEILSETDQMEEFMFLGLRLTKGISIYEFRNNFAKDIREVYGDVIDRLCADNLLVFDEGSGRLFLSDLGMDVANRCMAEFILR